jgi:hypothetical protein
MKGMQILMLGTGAEITGRYKRPEHELYNIQVLTPLPHTFKRNQIAVSYSTNNK